MTQVSQQVRSFKAVDWILRIAVFGVFLGHGVLALQLKPAFVAYITAITGFSTNVAQDILFSIGVIDVITAIFAIVFPFKLLLMWATAWGFATAIVRPITGESIWDFVERWANWGAPLALLYLRGLPQTIKQYFIR